MLRRARRVELCRESPLRPVDKTAGCFWRAQGWRVSEDRRRSTTSDGGAKSAMVDRILDTPNLKTKEQVIQVSGRIYKRNPEVDRYQIDIHELDELRMCDIPPQSHL